MKWPVKRVCTYRASVFEHSNFDCLVVVHNSKHSNRDMAEWTVENGWRGGTSEMGIVCLLAKIEAGT